MLNEPKCRIVSALGLALGKLESSEGKFAWPKQRNKRFKEPEMWSSSLLLCLLLQNGTTPLVQDLLARIEALEKRVAELEQEKKTAAAAPAAETGTPPQTPPPTRGAPQRRQH